MKKSLLKGFAVYNNAFFYFDTDLKRIVEVDISSGNVKCISKRIDIGTGGLSKGIVIDNQVIIPTSNSGIIVYDLKKCIERIVPYCDVKNEKLYDLVFDHGFVHFFSIAGNNSIIEYDC